MHFPKLIFILFLLSCEQPVDLIIPDDMPKFDIIVSDEDFDGYIFLRKVVSPGAQLAINSKGDIIWFHQSDTTLLRPFTPFENSYLALFSPKVIHEITYDGDTLVNLKYGEGGFDKSLHHEISINKNNNIIALTNEEISIDLSELGGEVLDTIKTTGIIVLSRAGDKLWNWSLESVLNPLTYPEINKRKKDWGHANALHVDDDGHYLISWRDFNAIWKIHNKTGAVIWKYGLENINTEEDKFYKQHAIHKNMDGDFMIFDNGDARTRKTTRAVAFKTEGDSIINTLKITLPDSLFTFKQGSVEQYAKNRFLFSSTTNQTLLITDRKGKILWLAKSDNAFYRAYYVEKQMLN